MNALERLTKACRLLAQVDTKHSARWRGDARRYDEEAAFWRLTHHRGFSDADLAVMEQQFRSPLEYAEGLLDQFREDAAAVAALAPPAPVTPAESAPAASAAPSRQG